MARITAAAAYATGIFALPPFLLGAIAPLVRADLAFDRAGLGLAVALFFGSAALASTIGGRLGDRVGSRLALIAASLVTASSMAGVALLAGTWAQLTACLCVAGMASGVGRPASSLALFEQVPASRQGLAFGIVQSAPPGGAMLAGLALPAVGLPLGWRACFLLAALLAAAVGLALPRPVTAPTAGPTAARAARHAGRVRARGVLVLALAAACGAGAVSVLGTFTVESAMAIGMREAAAGGLLVVAGLLAVVVKLGVGGLVDRTAWAPGRWMAGLLACGALGFCTLAMATTSAWFGLGVLVAFGAGWSWPGLLNLMVVRSNPEGPARATGITGGGASAGGVVGPYVFGGLASNGSFALAWLFTAVLAFGAAALSLTSRAGHPRTAHGSAP